MTRRAVLVRDIAQFVMGQAPPGKEVNSAGVGLPFFRSGEFGSIRPETVAWTTKPLKVAKSTDVFICVVGANAGEVNRGADGAIGRSIGAIRASEEVDSDYLYYFFKSREPVLRSAAQGSAQAVLSRDDLGRLPMELPPIAEQRAIAGVLGALDDKIESNRRVWALASSLIRSEYEASIRDGQTRSCILADICMFNVSTRKPGPPSEVISYIDISSVESGTVTGAQQVAWVDAPSRARRGVSDGDIIFSTVRPARMAYSVMIDPTPETVVSTGFAVMTPRNVPMTLLLALVSHTDFGNFCESVSQGSAYPAVSPEAMGTFPVEIPTAARVEQFGDLTEPVVRRAYGGTLENQTLVELRDALLPELLSGRLRVRDAEKVVEEVV